MKDHIPVGSNNSGASTQNSKFIIASPEILYNAFTSPQALETWMAPGHMTGRIHHFELKVGGGYQMSLFYPSSEKNSKGKTSEKEDSYNARFIELTPCKKIVQSITFDTSNDAFSGEMIMEITFEPKAAGTIVTIIFKNIPSGIKAKDNEEGTRSSLEKLAMYVAEN